MCDSAALIYMPLLEETGYMPTEKYAHGPEILEHCERIATQYGLHDKALFHTQVRGLRWEPESSRWRITTDRGDDFTAQFVSMGIGALDIPKIPGVPGVEEFEGHSFHTSRWDWGYTGGDPATDPVMRNLADQRVGFVGTGATAVQCVPELAAACKELYVFQRTPSAVDVRANRPFDPEWTRSIAQPGWQDEWIDNFMCNEVFSVATTEGADDDLIEDGWTAMGRQVRRAIAAIPEAERTPERLGEMFADIDQANMEAIRARIDSIVADPVVAEQLKPWYHQLCKRPCWHDEYLLAFNRPNTHLVDTDGKGVERVTRRGIVANGHEYELDCIIYGSGFEFATDYTVRAGFDPIGEDGTTLSEHWDKGMRTMHGVFVNGFPNLFVVQVYQGALLGSNVPHNFFGAAKNIAAVVRHAMESGARQVEVTPDAEQGWLDVLSSGVAFGGGDACTPGFFNNEGLPLNIRQSANLGYPGGAKAFLRLMDDWRSAEAFEGLRFG
jgi:cyclohexanone monooxygenase